MLPRCCGCFGTKYRHLANEEDGPVRLPTGRIFIFFKRYFQKLIVRQDPELRGRHLYGLIRVDAPQQTGLRYVCAPGPEQCLRAGGNLRVHQGPHHEIAFRAKGGGPARCAAGARSLQNRCSCWRDFDHLCRGRRRFTRQHETDKRGGACSHTNHAPEPELALQPSYVCSSNCTGRGSVLLRRCGELGRCMIGIQTRGTECGRGRSLGRCFPCIRRSCVRFSRRDRVIRVRRVWYRGIAQPFIGIRCCAVGALGCGGSQLRSRGRFRWNRR